MAGQEPKNDPNAQNKSLLATDGETDSETRRIHSRTRGAINAVSVEIVDASGNQITSFGGGTQYADGVVRGTATGTLAMGDDGTNIQSVHVDASGDLQVDVLTMPTVAVTGTFWQATQPVSGTFWQATQPISGSVTANAGTNLNTSLLALESGGNLATIAGKDFATQTTLALIKAKTDNIPALGQALAAASVPVVLTDAQITTLTPPAAITGFALEAGGNLASIKTDVDKIPSQGTAVMTGSTPVTIATNDTVLSKLTYANTRLITAPHANNAGTPVDTTIYNATQSVVAVGIGAYPQGADSLEVQGPETVGAARVGKPVVIAGIDNAGTPLVQIPTVEGDNATAFAKGMTVLAGKAVSAATAVTAGRSTALQILAASGRVLASATIDAALPAGTNAIGKLAANNGVDIGDVDVATIAAGANLIGDVAIQPRTSGGWSIFNATSGDGHTALTNSAQVVKASAGQLGGYYIYNPNAAAIYVHVYNVAAASVTVGTTTALMNFCIPASSAANVEITAGIPFSTAMSCAATTTGGGNTAPTTALECMIYYK